MTQVLTKISLHRLLGKNPSMALNKEPSDILDEEKLKFEYNGLSLFQKILLITDGTVTDLISLYSNESIRVQKLDQEIVTGGAPEELCCAADTPLLRRTVLLKSVTKNYLFAESFFIFEKLSRPIQYKLLETETPIGLMWKEEKAESFREIIECRVEMCEKTIKHFDVESDTPLLSRTYTIRRQQELFGLITEKFPFTYFRQDKNE